MPAMWYPSDKKELNAILEKFLVGKTAKEKINGVIVPHAGYEYSGSIAGKAYSKLKAEKAIILSPSHYIPLLGIRTHDRKILETPLGKIKISESEFKKIDLTQEHAIDNQIPFLQKIDVKEILPIVVGEITKEEAEKIAKEISNFKGVFIFSTDLSHFLTYADAKAKDLQTIKIIENIDLKNIDKIDACGIYPLLILLNLCKIKNWKPKLIEYKNSGDVTGDKRSVVGYASFVF